MLVFFSFCGLYREFSASPSDDTERALTSNRRRNRAKACAVKGAAGKTNFGQGTLEGIYLKCLFTP